MKIVGHGIDVVELAGFAKLLEEPEFVGRCFSTNEHSRLMDGANRLERLAGHFAAKEAVAKALGTGFNGEVAPTDIEITNGASGEPLVVLHGGAAAIAQNLGISKWSISISHVQTIAIASAIAVSE